MCGRLKSFLWSHADIFSEAVVGSLFGKQYSLPKDVPKPCGGPLRRGYRITVHLCLHQENLLVRYRDCLTSSLVNAPFVCACLSMWMFVHTRYVEQDVVLLCTFCPHQENLLVRCRDCLTSSLVNVPFALFLGFSV